jgi:hypothetical protein
MELHPEAPWYQFLFSATVGHSNRGRRKVSKIGEFSPAAEEPETRSGFGRKLAVGTRAAGRDAPK